MKIFILLCGILLAVSGFASAPQSLMLGCDKTGIAMTQKQILFSAKAGGQRLYIIHNISKNTVWLDHVAAHPAASAGWGSKLEAGHWSALALDKKQFGLICERLPQNGGIKKLVCGDVITVCSVKNAQFPKDSTGSFWVSENKADLPTLLHQITLRHIH